MLVGTSTETNFISYRVVNSDQNINSDNCYKDYFIIINDKIN